MDIVILQICINWIVLGSMRFIVAETTQAQKDFDEGKLSSEDARNHWLNVVFIGFFCFQCVLVWSRCMLFMILLIKKHYIDSN